MSDQVLYCVLIPESRGTLDVRPSALLCVDTWITWNVGCQTKCFIVC